MKKILKVLSLLKNNLGSLIAFEIIFKFLSLMIFTPLFFHLFDLIMKITKYHYLTLENIIPFLMNPFTILLLIILIIFMTFYTMFDITTIIIILDASYQNKKIKVYKAIYMSLNKCKKVFKIKNIMVSFLVLFLIPFLNFGLAPSFITSIQIPEFILEFILQNQNLLILFIITLLFLIILLLKWLYALHYFVLEDINFKEARKKSNSLSSKKHLKDVISLFFIQFALFILYIVFIVIGILIIIGLNKMFVNIIILKSVATTIIWVFIAISFLVLAFLTVPISYAGISVMYYFHKITKGEKIKHIKIQNKSEINSKLKIVIALFIGIAIIGGSIFTYGIYKGKYNLNIEYIRAMEVTAHRGSSINYPENTMTAFVAAKNEGADWIELDVRKTKDDKIIVMHDKSLKRITGIDKKVWKVTYDEIKDIEVGTYINKAFTTERIPLLEDVIKWAKDNNMKLNIELKPTGHEKDLEKSVIQLINKYDYINDCVLASQTYEVLENIKKYDKNMKTVYVISLLYGDIDSFTAADQFSIEASSITSSLVKQIHKEGKQIYAWTINTEEGIKEMLDMQVDNVVTDDVSLAKKIIYSNRTSNIINEYIKMIENLF